MTGIDEKAFTDAIQGFDFADTDGRKAGSQQWARELLTAYLKASAKAPGDSVKRVRDLMAKRLGHWKKTVDLYELAADVFAISAMPESPPAKAQPGAAVVGEPGDCRCDVPYFTRPGCKYCGSGKPKRKTGTPAALPSTPAQGLVEKLEKEMYICDRIYDQYESGYYYAKEHAIYLIRQHTAEAPTMPEAPRGDKPVHHITANGCSICGTDALNCNWFKERKAALTADAVLVDIEAGADAIYAAALSRANFSGSKVNDTREFSRLMAKACASAWRLAYGEVRVKRDTSRPPAKPAPAKMMERVGMGRTYDEECEFLAKHFLVNKSPKLVKELAQHIQDAVEEWIMRRNV